jgi:serine/threonine-protein phosphatase 2A regulatory subunit B''
LHHKTSEILDKEDLEKLWILLKENVSPPEDMKERVKMKIILDKLFCFSQYSLNAAP